MAISLETAQKAFNIDETGDSLSRLYLILATNTLSLMFEFMLRVALEQPQHPVSPVKLNAGLIAMHGCFALLMSQTVFDIQIGIPQRFFSSLLSSLPGAIWDIFRRPAVRAEAELELLPVPVPAAQA